MHALSRDFIGGGGKPREDDSVFGHGLIAASVSQFGEGDQIQSMSKGEPFNQLNIHSCLFFN